MLTGESNEIVRRKRFYKAEYNSESGVFSVWKSGLVRFFDPFGHRLN